jgi:divalent metal cation (Fe/Co/Zn/Cd) transporter
MNPSSLTRFAWLSIAAAILTIGLKALAYQLTGSVGLLSDALESFVNLAGALMALAMLTIAARPADEDHLYGQSSEGMSCWNVSKRTYGMLCQRLKCLRI